MQKIAPELQFELRYEAIFKDRWRSLKSALKSKTLTVARLNRFLPHTLVAPLVAERPSLGEIGLEDCYLGEFKNPGDVLIQGKAPYYLLDAASIFPCKALQVEPGQSVLDLCAAPGGKALVLIQELWKTPGKKSEFIANEQSDIRRARMAKVFEQYLPREVFTKIKVTPHDAMKWGLYEQDRYDRILVDVPCSGERHLLQDASELAKWSPSRSKNLAIRQFAMISAALTALKPGGILVYSTCALNPQENDEVVLKLLQRHSDKCEVLPIEECPIGETTRLGWQILPDRDRFGPIYFAKIQKRLA